MSSATKALRFEPFVPIADNKAFIRLAFAISRFEVVGVEGVEGVFKKFKRTKEKSLLFASDFPEYDQNYISDLLSIYVREGKLVRLANGVYLKTTVTKFGPVFPSPTEIAEAIARRDHAQVLMSGLAAENYFGP